MLLDAVLDDPTCAWLGPARDKRRYFIRHLESRLDAREYPHLTFGDEPEKTVYFPDKLPIGVLPGLDHHAFVYLVRAGHRWTSGCSFCGMCPSTRALPMDDSTALPRPLWKARLVYQHAAREHLGERLEPANVQVLEWLFPERKRLAEPGAAPADERYMKTSKNFGAPRFRALYASGSKILPTPSGWPGRPRLPTRSIAITAASSASSSRSIFISLPG